MNPNRLSSTTSLYLGTMDGAPVVEHHHRDDRPGAGWVRIEDGSTGIVVHYRTPEQLRAFLDAIAVAAGLS